MKDYDNFVFGLMFGEQFAGINSKISRIVFIACKLLAASQSQNNDESTESFFLERLNDFLLVQSNRSNMPQRRDPRCDEG